MVHNLKVCWTIHRTSSAQPNHHHFKLCWLPHKYTLASVRVVAVLWKPYSVEEDSIWGSARAAFVASSKTKRIESVKYHTSHCMKHPHNIIVYIISVDWICNVKWRWGASLKVRPIVTFLERRIFLWSYLLWLISFHATCGQWRFVSFCFLLLIIASDIQWLEQFWKDKIAAVASWHSYTP